MKRKREWIKVKVGKSFSRRLANEVEAKQHIVCMYVAAMF